MNVLAYDPYKPASEFPDGVEVVRNLDRIFKECDYVSLHCPNTPVTKNMVNKERLAMMKPTAFLINTARGGCVDEDALYEACKNGVIAGAGLDAIKKEPVDPANPLLTLDNVIIYPHIGGNTSEAAHRASYFAAMGVQEVYEGKKATWPINDVDYETAKTYTDTKNRIQNRLECLISNQSFANFFSHITKSGRTYRNDRFCLFSLYIYKINLLEFYYNFSVNHYLFSTLP